MKAVYLLVLYLSCVLGCYKYCNGHGSCGPKDKCECYLGWGGACPYGEALVDIPLGDLDHSGSVDSTVVKTEWRPKYGLSENLKGYVTKSRAHRYAECSNSGNCDRATGECVCYNGYEGSACQRRSCPTAVEGSVCSGNGVCMSSTAYAKEQGSAYYGWELDKFFTCKCDAGYEGVDCSLRQCPMGLDPIKYAGATMTYKPAAAGVAVGGDDYYFELTYDGVKYVTPMISKIPPICGTAGSFAYDSTLANTYQEIMKRALQSVAPLRQASVKVECANPAGNQNPDGKMLFTITAESSEPMKFIESTLESKTVDGSIPGPDFKFTATVTADKEYIKGSTNGLTETLCAGRGLCDSKTGLCSCFQGYYGYACENQRTIQL